MKVYKVDALDGLDVPLKDLAAKPHTTIDVAAFRKLASRARWVDQESVVLWKGGTLAVVDVDGKGSIRIAASSYGGFFLVESYSGYYDIDESDRDEWERLGLGR